MSTFDEELKTLLSEEDETFILDTIDEEGYYTTAFKSLKGQGSGLRIGAWIAVAVTCSLLFFCIWKFFQVETIKEQIFFASAAVLLNSGQIAFKLWFNMQLNRRAITKEIRRLELVIAKALASK